MEDRENYVVATHEPDDQRSHPLLSIYGQRVIAFRRELVPLAGGVLAALMLSQALYWTKRSDEPGQWFYKTREQWEEETGMTRYEQETARKHLCNSGFWQEELRGVPAKMYYRVKVNVLAEKLALAVSSWWESSQLVGGNPANKKDGIQPTITESTTEITTKSKVRKRTTQAPDAASTTESVVHKEMFAAVCNVVGWNYKTLDKKHVGMVAQTVGVLEKAGYTPAEVDRFVREVWRHDWRWTKNEQMPSLSDLRTEIGKLKKAAPAKGKGYITDPVTGQRSEVEL